MSLPAWLTLDFADHVATIATAIVAVWAYAAYRLRKRQKRIALENYLATLEPEQVFKADKGQRSIVHLMAELSMTEAEIFDAAFSSQKIKASTRIDPAGFADKILFSVPKYAGGAVGE